MESSDEEDGEPDVKDPESDDEGFVTLGGDSNDRDEDLLAEIDLDENAIANLDAQAKAYAEANPEEEEADEEDAPRTRRLAVVNLDWDHVRASHLYKICASLVSPTAPAVGSTSKKPEVLKPRWTPKNMPQVNVARGKVLSVVVYPSDFGKGRMAREEKEGPPAEIFKKRNDDEEITEKSLFEVGGEDDVDESALRKYQLERLRYVTSVPLGISALTDCILGITMLSLLATPSRLLHISTTNSRVQNSNDLQMCLISASFRTICLSRTNQGNDTASLISRLTLIHYL